MTTIVTMEPRVCGKMQGERAEGPGGESGNTFLTALLSLLAGAAEPRAGNVTAEGETAGEKEGEFSGFTDKRFDGKEYLQVLEDLIKNEGKYVLKIGSIPIRRRWTGGRLPCRNPGWRQKSPPSRTEPCRRERTLCPPSGGSCRRRRKPDGRTGRRGREMKPARLPRHCRRKATPFRTGSRRKRRTLFLPNGGPCRGRRKPSGLRGKKERGEGTRESSPAPAGRRPLNRAPRRSSS